MEGWVMGKHALEELLRYAPQRILHLYTLASQENSELVHLAKEHHIPVTLTHKDNLTRKVESESHQSFVARVRREPPQDLKSFFAEMESKEHALTLMLDKIFDPQNLGSLLRSAECFGADAAVLSKNRGADITPVVAKASSGASELLPLLIVSNLAETAGRFQKEGFEVVAAALEPDAENAYAFSFAPKTLLIVGSEGEGIQPLLLKKADRTIAIPLRGKIASLNVSQATSALLFAYCSKGSFNNNSKIYC